MKGIIFSSGEIRDYDMLKKLDFSDKYIICADNGYSHALKLGIVPDVIIGDNDSYKTDYPENIKHFLYPPEKDYTDTNMAINLAIEYGCDEIDLYGGLGGRADHEFSHYCLIKYALDRGVKLKMIDDINEIWMENKPFVVPPSDKKYVSFFAYGGEVTHVSIKGFKYEAEDMELSPGLVQASSNEYTENGKAEVKFESGTVLVILSNDRK